MCELDLNVLLILALQFSGMERVLTQLIFIEGLNSVSCYIVK